MIRVKRGNVCGLAEVSQIEDLKKHGWVVDNSSEAPAPVTAGKGGSGPDTGGKPTGTTPPPAK